MTMLLRKTLTASLAALTLFAGIAATTSPASAYFRPHHGGYGHGFGHGHYYGGRGYYGYRGGWGPGWGWGPAILGGLAFGAFAGAACNQLQPVYDPYGNYVGRRWVWVC